MIRYRNSAHVFSDTAVGGAIRSLFSIKCFWVLVYSGVAQVYITANCFFSEDTCLNCEVW